MSELRLDSERPKRFVLIHFLICYSRSASFSFIRLIYLLYLLKHLNALSLVNRQDAPDVPGFDDALQWNFSDPGTLIGRGEKFVGW